MPTITVNINKKLNSPLIKVIKFYLHYVASKVKYILIYIKNTIYSLRIRKDNGKIKHYRVVAMNLQALGDTTIGFDAFRILQCWADESSNRDVIFVIKDYMKEWLQTRIAGANVIGVSDRLDDNKVSSEIINFRPEILIDFDSSDRMSGYEIQKIVTFKKRFGFRSKGKKFWYDEGPHWNDVFETLRTYPTQLHTRVGALYEELAILFTKKNKIKKDNIPCIIDKNQIVIHAGASHPSQIWHHFIGLVRLLASWYKGQIILTGHYGDKNTLKIYNKLLSEINTIKYVPTKNLLELCELIKGSELLICNNSGPLHVAVELGIKTLSITGPSHSIWWPGQKTEKRRLHYVLVSDMPCVGCVAASRCPYDLQCLNGIDAHVVSAYVREIIR